MSELNYTTIGDSQKRLQFAFKEMCEDESVSNSLYLGMFKGSAVNHPREMINHRMND